MKRVIELQVTRIFVFPDTSEFRMMLEITVEYGDRILVSRRSGLPGQIAVAVCAGSICQSDQRRIAALVIAVTGGTRSASVFALL